ncbi:SDR family oxidoreductase [Paenibacillus polysaccharolyticus]|uniref:SDR family NAD(P)-dependent oxidoreductase n=1 Tax=Paenibacillus polysaccharolyticus TaxID=582692 RepID=UPI00203AE6E8|nr:SDR family NAD(P)-dependent oxidoreductase [Paenibacillus polysaccharolyticus]MCM3135795.1 SDR family oxidoreductase [Paenibacillus polysaccharolyticus]
MNLNLEDKVVVITGGSRGIGKGLVEAFARYRCKVYFTYLSSSKSAEDLARSLNEQGFFVRPFKVDGISLEEVKTFINDIISDEKRIDILINNAGYIPRGLFLGTAEETFKHTIDSNLLGVYNYCQSVLKNMILNKQGVILNITTVSSYQPSKGQAAYSASKAAIESLTKVLALEYGKYNIRVNSIAPGLIETEIVKSISDKVKSDILLKTPLDRFGSVEDVSDSALFLASEKAAYITGVQLLVTGGKHLC